jgi:hypothetical protein
MYFPFYLCFGLPLVESQTETQKKIKYRSAEGRIAGCLSRVISSNDSGFKVTDDIPIGVGCQQAFTRIQKD